MRILLLRTTCPVPLCGILAKFLLLWPKTPQDLVIRFGRWKRNESHLCVFIFISLCLRHHVLIVNKCHHLRTGFSHLQCFMKYVYFINGSNIDFYGFPGYVVKKFASTFSIIVWHVGQMSSAIGPDLPNTCG